jgi:hypothetical protein
MLAQTLLRIGCREQCARNNSSNAASCQHFQCQNRRCFRAFKAGYWKKNLKFEFTHYCIYRIYSDERLLSGTALCLPIQYVA